MKALSFQLLRVLTDATYHSGAKLARRFDVTRGTIWNAVHELQLNGFAVHSMRGRGYCLEEPVCLLDRDAVMRCLGDSASRFQIELVDVTASTNTRLMEQAAQGAPSGAVVAAELQQRGRGRMGRVWHAQIGGALTFSLLWRFPGGAAALAGLSLAAGVALVRALARLGARDIRLKWPNDVLADGGKLAGMLIEMQGDALGPSAAVIGIGLNTRLSAEIREKIDQPATDLASACGHAIDRNVALAAVLTELAAALEAFAASGFAPIKAEWERYHVHQGQEIQVKLPTGAVQHGIARGVDDDGALLFETGGAIHRLHSGEISVRPSGHAAGPVQPGIRSRA
jgi:BirA family biotin operon repressor/biotin-[acetyl-CoA-carboxylase] ligase